MVTSMLAGMLERQTGRIRLSRRFPNLLLGSWRLIAVYVQAGTLEDAQMLKADLRRLAPQTTLEQLAGRYGRVYHEH